ncbi:hypothetical protein HJG54_07140 [Leptolyngbya sp. NK1-12]|uniref:DUF6883 domain-containing protein n=1 Tax=Leptolyngbya sp. NK1-12 TaxID=2547451 RepID=A0AA97AS54_9CYAN|nr:hypothetical protein HJG54_07140 [Leptolyngbya sp. NK1-12]
MQLTCLDFPLEKAIYLFTYAAEPGRGGDKQRFWREVMGFESPAAIRGAILAELTVDALSLQGQNEYGYRFQAVVSITGPSGLSWRVRTGWLVRHGETIARFITAIPERLGRQA